MGNQILPPPPIPAAPPPTPPIIPLSKKNYHPFLISAGILTIVLIILLFFFWPTLRTYVVIFGSTIQSTAFPKNSGSIKFYGLAYQYKGRLEGINKDPKTNAAVLKTNVSGIGVPEFKVTKFTRLVSVSNNKEKYIKLSDLKVAQNLSVAVFYNADEKKWFTTEVKVLE